MSSTSRIAPKHHQGSRPPDGHVLRKLGFQALILCEAEWQPSAPRFPGIVVLHCPLHDELEPLSFEDRVQISDVAHEATMLIKRGSRVLVACHMGINRSGIVSAAMLMNRYGLSGREAIAMVQRGRPGALQNPFFRQALETIPSQAASPRRDRAVAL